MDRVVDIRPEKSRLRADLKQFRQSMPIETKSALDRKIQNRLMNLWAFREAQTILCYVSTPAEIDTIHLIASVLESGRTVAVPRCEDGASRMSFYVIRSLFELSPGHFNVLEPDGGCALVTGDQKSALCIVPALAFDREGFRLGYGKGYYDRFLNQYQGMTAGMCYTQCLYDALPHGKYDRTVQILVTEKEIVTIPKMEEATNG